MKAQIINNIFGCRSWCFRQGRQLSPQSLKEFLHGGTQSNGGELSFFLNLNHRGSGDFSQWRTEQTPLFNSVTNLS